MMDIRFNYCLPREYKNKEGKIDFALCRGNEAMNVGTLDEIIKHADRNKPKLAQPWAQVFNNGYRVTNDNIDWSEWNGVTFSDVDSKWFYDYNKKFNVEKLLRGINDTAMFLYNYNYYGAYITSSGKGYRILWFWDCERTEDNFKKCALMTEKYTRELFYKMGDDTRQIIDYNYNGRKVLDSCSKSIKQGLYVIDTNILYNDFINDEHFGAVDIEDIRLEGLYKDFNSNVIRNGKKQNDFIEYKGRSFVNVNDIKYFPHQHRRCIYEALMVLFKDKSKVDEQWREIANMLPESDGFGGGHDHKFYENEPDKNKWFERFNDKVEHGLHWLNDFGYTYNDKSEYIYVKQFIKSWRHHINEVAARRYIDKNNEGLKKEERKNMIDTMTGGHKVFDNIYDDINGIEELRSSYYKTRFNREDFKYLCYGYDIAKDIVTYKMYADFYYRDDNYLPIIKYNILEDDILLYGYDYENEKVCWHTLYFDDEFTHWCNNDEFSNKAVKEKMIDGLSKYVKKWFSFHSIKKYLYDLDLTKADEELLETWAIRYFKAEDKKYVREISKKFFIAAVKKMLIDDPTKFVFQHMLLLCGATGCGKTFFIVNMFTFDGKQVFLNDIKPDDSDKEIGPKVAKNWMIHFGESRTLSKADVNAVKEFVDRVNLAMKYQKKFKNEQTTVYPRVVICRTSNEDTLFNDTSISEGDRRNWLIVCNSAPMSCDDNLKKIIKNERDILWATAMKLYLDDPEQDLELNNESYKELFEKQEDYKMIKTSDIKEIYDEIFNREYLTNGKGHIKDEYVFNKMLERSDKSLNDKDIYVQDILDDNIYVQHQRIHRLPVTWLKNYVIKKYGVNTFKLLKRHLGSIGWTVQNTGYNDKVVRCWVL